MIISFPTSTSEMIFLLTLRRTRWVGVFLSFSFDEKTSAPDGFSSCSFIPCAHFETSFVMVSYYGYEI